MVCLVLAYMQPVTFDCLAAGQHQLLTVGYYSKQMDIPDGYHVFWALRRLRAAS